MRIYCPICKMNIVDTTPDFVCGGPYAAGMFKPGARFTAAQYNVAALKTKRPEHLPCPRCKKPFINRDGSILTEHGLIRAGQATVDMSFSIVYPDGHEHAGMLMTAQEWSRECTTYSGKPENPDPQDFGPREPIDAAKAFAGIAAPLTEAEEIAGGIPFAYEPSHAQPPAPAPKRKAGRPKKQKKGKE